MSEPENFLTRWSRRKQEAEREQKPVRPEGKGPPKADADDHRLAPQTGEKQEAELDLSKLPSLDSITASTDVRVFLQKGIPAELTRAALRRAWTSDPAIRDFIEVAENQWDFATGSDIPGFGPLETTEEIRRMVASMFEPPAEASAQPDEAKAESAAQAETDARATSPDTERENIQTFPDASEMEDEVDQNAGNIAAQHTAHDPEPSPPTRKRHGSALPE